MEIQDNYYADIAAGDTVRQPFRDETRIAPFNGLLSVGVIGEAQDNIRFSVTVGGVAVARSMRSTAGTAMPSVSQIQIRDIPVRAGQTIAIELENRDSVNAQMAWATFRLGVTPLRS